MPTGFSAVHRRVVSVGVYFHLEPDRRGKPTAFFAHQPAHSPSLKRSGLDTGSHLRLRVLGLRRWLAGVGLNDLSSLVFRLQCVLIHTDASMIALVDCVVGTIITHFFSPVQKI